MASSPLVALERLRSEFGAEAASAKLALLGRLARARLGSARSVLRLHEALCFIRAYPDDAEVLARVRSMLDGFAKRADLRAHREALADSGIAGTEIRWRFFAGQAQWLAERWPRRLRLDRRDPDAGERIARALAPLVTHAEATALNELKPPGYAALDRLGGAGGKGGAGGAGGKGETDAVFLLRRIAAMPGNGFTREAFTDTVDAAFVLLPGPDTPSRTAAWLPWAPVVLRGEPPPRARPDLRVQLMRAPRSARRLSLREGAEVVALARAAMITRERSLEAFSFANARDAWLVDDGDGLAFAFTGVVPERRHALASYYGGLTLRNGVPIGYSQCDLLGASAALSFNTFETFRGMEAAFVFARWLAALHHLFGAASFSIEPYQLGQHNDEAIESGAWWFYTKLGFAPRDRVARDLARAEIERVRRSPHHRTRPATLRQLAERHLFFELDPAHPRPRVDLAALGMEVGATLSARSGSDRERGVAEIGAELMQRCGVESLRGFTPEQREAWHRIAPVVALLDLGDWRPGERRALVELVRAKGGRSERDYLVAYAGHPRLDGALLKWVRAHGG